MIQRDAIQFHLAFWQDWRLIMSRLLAQAPEVFSVEDREVLAATSLQLKELREKLWRLMEGHLGDRQQSNTLFTRANKARAQSHLEHCTDTPPLSRVMGHWTELCCKKCVEKKQGMIQWPQKNIRVSPPDKLELRYRARLVPVLELFKPLK